MHREAAETIDLSGESPQCAPPAKRARLGRAVAEIVDLTAEEQQERSRAGSRRQAVSSATAAEVARRRGFGGPGHVHNPAAAAAAAGLRCYHQQPQQQQQQQQQARQHPLASGDVTEDFCLAKQLQEEEDRRAAAAVEAEAHLQRRFRQLEAAEAAAEAEQAAAAAAAAGRGWGRGFMGGWFGGSGSSGGGAPSGHRQRHSSGAGGGAAAAAALAGAGAAAPFVPPRAASWGPRSQRSRRGPAAEAEFADAMVGALMGPPAFQHGHGFGHGYGAGGSAGGYGYGARRDFMGADLQALQQMMAGLSRGLPAHLLLSGRDFTDADYEQLLALDEGIKRRTAPLDRVNQLETVRVPPAGSAAAAAAAGGGAGGGNRSPLLELDTCVICLEDARPGDRFRVLGCRHSFHQKCIDRWLMQERNSCPICQRQAV